MKDWQKRTARHTGFRRTGGLSGVAHWTINLPHTCLQSRRLQRRRAKYDVTHLNNSQGRHQRGTNTARQVGRATELGRWRLSFVGHGCGTWFMSLTWRLKFSAGSYIYGKFVHLWCRLLAKGLLNWKVWGTHPRSKDLWTINTFLGHQLAWHIILCVSQSTYPQEHTWMKRKFYTQNPVPVSLQMYLQTRDLHVL